MRISDWSSDVCSSDLNWWNRAAVRWRGRWRLSAATCRASPRRPDEKRFFSQVRESRDSSGRSVRGLRTQRRPDRGMRSEEHTSELQSLMRISYAVFCLKKKTYKDTSLTT